MNRYSTDSLKVLFNACFDSDPEIAEEARHLSKFFIEFQLINMEPGQKSQFSSELSENDDFRCKYGELNLYGGEFSKADVEVFVRNLLQEFMDRPTERKWLAAVLKRASPVAGVEEEIANFIMKHWSEDELVTDSALSIIWDLSVLSGLKDTLLEIRSLAKNTQLKDHADQRLDILSQLG